MKSKLMCIISVLVCLTLLIACAACSTGDSSDSSSTASSKKGASYITPSKAKPTSRAISAAFVQKTKIKIMPLGDSLTQGQNGVSAYRGFLEKLLTDGGYNFQFVGSHNWTSDTVTYNNNKHSGYGGARIETIQTELNNMYECDPDVVLLMIGRNDCTDGVSPEDAVQKIDTMIVEKIFKMYPDAHIFLANPPPICNYNGQDAEGKNNPITEKDTINTSDKAIQYAPAYKAYVEQKQSEGAKISFVDMSLETTGLTALDFIGGDFVHPGADGYEKIANQWYASIKDKVDEIRSAIESDVLSSENEAYK